MQIYGKSVASIESTDDEKFGPNGGFTAVLSTPSLDRDGDVLGRKEWVEPLPDRLPLDVDHGMSVADTIGSFHPYWDGDTMMMDAYFAGTARAQEVRSLVKDLHVGHVSVAFMRDKTKKSGEPQREIIGAGVVSVPANRDAKIMASKAAHALHEALSTHDGDVPADVREAVLKALGIEVEVKSEESKSIAYAGQLAGIGVEGIMRTLLPEQVGLKAVDGNMALLQAIHDASCHLGAMCSVSEPDVDEGTGASEGANKSADVDEKSVETAEIEAETPETSIDSQKLTLDEFKAAAAALHETSTQEDSPAETPEAPVDETPASPVDAPEPDVVDDAALLRMKMLLALSETE